MKLVLTSGGISNKSIESELKAFIGKEFKGLKMLFCITASSYDGGVMNDWLIEDIEYFKKLGFSIDVCDINGIGIDRLLPRFEWADVYFFEGGNTQWLRECIKNSGLGDYLNKLLETRVWIGASAGSCILCPTICNAVQDLYDENVEGLATDGLGFVDFQFMPHLNNEICPKIKRDNITKASKNLNASDGEKIYILDDESALFIDGDDIKVVSEGEYFEIIKEC